MAVISTDDANKLWTLLDHLGHDLEPSILIGGWATQFRVGGEISRDIDLIINSASLGSTLPRILHDYSENSHHGGDRKGRGSVHGIHVDAYFPHESRLGEKLRLDVAVLARHTDEELVRGWLLLTLEAHLVTKCAALLDRPDSEKGAKDAREIIALLSTGVDGPRAIEILLSASSSTPEEVVDHLRTLFTLLPERGGANKALRRRLADQRREWIDEAQRQIRREENKT